MFDKILQITRNVFTPLINNRLKQSMIFGFWNMVCGKKRKPRIAGNQQKPLQSKDHPLLTFEIARQLLKSNQFGI